MSSHLKLLRKQLQKIGQRPEMKRQKIAVPSLWLSPQRKATKPRIVKVSPCEFYVNAIDAILRQKRTKMTKSKAGNWTRDAVIYNMFLRSTCAFDHNQNGTLDLPANPAGWRETGTLLKAIALLPYIKSLGVNVIHLLPITSIGSDGNKGNLGSPYAIRNPYELDENLGEPNLGLGVEEEFKAFVEGAHHLGIRVVVEFVFRTAAKDSDWVKQHPEWFYWIRENIHDRLPGEQDETGYGNPIFSRQELDVISEKVRQHSFRDLPPPHDEYRRMFTSPPVKEKISKERGRWIGVLEDGTRVRIPGAFADWPPDDRQPPWGDVTYLKMYNHPGFNYIAYNTIRMYDSSLAQSVNINTSLWETIAGIVPHYQNTYGINGVMIDMGHALPMELKQEMIHRARANDPDFAFWDENFSVSEKSVREGYNAVFGYQWSDQHHPDKFRNLLRKFSSEGFPLPFFATPESHNTPRAAARPGGTRYSRYAWVLSNFVPAIPFLHSGFELGEKFPVNTGLDFSGDDLKRYPSEQLPLFSAYAYDWMNGEKITDWVKLVSGIRAKYHDLIVDAAPGSFEYLDGENQHILSFVRTHKRTAKAILILANSDMQNDQRFTLHVPTKRKAVRDLLSKKNFSIAGSAITGVLKPGEVVAAEL